ncbi:MAG TPA: triose-phosphate isomerase [Acidimicrobiales bacterium]|jgi:triosephosphate isomerase
MTPAGNGRKPLISGNWKMNLDHFEAIRAVQKLAYLLTAPDFDAVDVSIHPPFTDLRSAQVTLADQKATEIALGAQNCHWEDKGALTGEVSPAFLAKLEVRYVIAGHSERRELFGETDADVNRKVKAILRHEMVPIMCVGETLDEREAGATESKIVGQIEAGLAGLKAEQVASMVVAYEPIWAIGTGRTASPDDAQAVCALVRGDVERLYDTGTASSVRVQYGGSVKAENIVDLMAERDIDGALVGGASLDPDEFARIAQYHKG